jgi:L-asparaginase
LVVDIAGFLITGTTKGSYLSIDEILIVTTGGTIDKVYFDAKSDYEVGESVLDELLKQAHVSQPFFIAPLMRKDSLEVTDEDRLLITSTIKQATQSRVVITHGTDTMTDTAACLADVSGKTIVLTGSLAPARFAQSDATFNVGMAFAAVQSLSEGVYIVMNGKVFRADEVRKDRSINEFVTL